jgi:hypothetical protein
MDPSFEKDSVSFIGRSRVDLGSTRIDEFAQFIGLESLPTKSFADRKYQGIQPVMTLDKGLPAGFLDTFYQQMTLFGISKLEIVGYCQGNLSITNLASALSLKKLNYLSLGHFHFKLLEMQLLSQTFGVSQLKELILIYPEFESDLGLGLDELEPVIRGLTDGLVNSFVEIVEFLE